MLSVIAIPAIAFVLLQNKNIQNYLAKEIAGKLSVFFNTHVTVGNVDLDFMGRLVIRKVYIEDQKSDTLVYADKLTVSIHALNLVGKVVRIEKIELDKALVRLYIDSSKTLNLAFIIDKLIEKKDSVKKGWDVSFDNIGFIDSRFMLLNYYKETCDTGINFSDLKLDDLNIRVKNLKVENKIASFKINKLTFKERSGFVLDNLSAKMSVCNTLMHFDNVQISTPRSDVKAPKVYFNFDSIKNMKYFVNKVEANYVFEKSQISFIDISFFAPKLWGMGELVTMSGSAKGKISDFRCHQIALKFGRASVFNGNLSFTGLPKINETFMFIDAKTLLLLPSDLESLYIPGINGNKFLIPETVKKTGYIDFKGNFTGFINDFVAYGTLKTQLGTIKMDLSLKPEPKNTILFNGQLSTFGFNVGKLTGRENIMGKADLTITASGQIEDNKNINGTFDGNINSFDLYGYKYSDINIKGTLQDNIFTGSVLLDDPNIKLAIGGRFNFSTEIPEFDFSAELTKAGLHELHVVKDDSIFNVSGNVVANFKGKNFGELEGNIHLKTFHILQNNKVLDIKDLLLISQKNQFNIKSDIADISISGQRNFGLIIPSLINFLKLYVPASLIGFQQKVTFNENSFNFNINLKNTKAICKFFLNEADIAENTNLSGVFRPNEPNISMVLKSDYLQFGNKSFEGVNVECNSSPDSIWAIIKSKRMFLDNQKLASNIEINSSARNDSVLVNLSWTNKDTLYVKSQLNGLANFSKIKNNLSPELNITIFPAQVNFLDSLWDIGLTTFVIDTTCISVPRMKISQNKQVFSATGKISENPADTMNFEFSNFNLQNIEFLLKTDKFKFEGALNGKANMTDFYHKRLFNSAAWVDKLILNKEILGNTNLDITWINETQNIRIIANSYKAGFQTVHAEGQYFPSTRGISFTLDASKIGAMLFQPFFEGTFTLQKGTVTGKVEFSGDLDKPILNADIIINNGSFGINFLNTSYNFDTRLRIEDNKFFLFNVILTDKNNNQATATGSISNTYLKDFFIDLIINIDNVLVLNTTANDNSTFYGTAYATGKVHIFGPANNINIDISKAKTGKNTIVYIPIDRSGTVAENNFLTFSSQKVIKQNKKKFVPATFEVNNTGLTVDLALDINPDAEVQLIFDPKIGGNLRSHGSGNIKIHADNRGNFAMRGDYKIESGDYLFILQNLINLKFILEPGGIISWTGNPTDANIDVEAIYHTRASLFNLNQTSEFKKRVPVDCQLFLKGKLLNPEIKYNISLPNSSIQEQDMVRAAISNDEALSRQFLMLLVTGNFYPTQNSDNPLSNVGTGLATNTSYGMLSSQLSDWLSQISKDFDVGFTYMPGDKVMNNQDIEVALSTQILNDRVSINGNLGVMGNQADPNNATKANNMVGDVNVDVKLTENGKLKLKAFNRTNDQLLIEQNTYYTQGVGLLYKEEFSTFGELSKRVYQNLFENKKRKSERLAKDSLNNVKHLQIKEK